MFYNMFLAKRLIYRIIRLFGHFLPLCTIKNRLLIIWRRSNKKFTLESIREKNQ
jgi:hypothetical protein